jgi:MOSC domain-containing protein YiiM
MAGRDTVDGVPARLLSVNVGRPAPLRTRGDRLLRSAIVKTPVEGPVRVVHDQLEGDEQADGLNHGGPSKALYAYAAEDTAWWAARLGRPLAPAAFGENLTLAGVDVTNARLGERWRIGGAELAVTGPRVPCAKLGARMGDPRFPKGFARAARPGAYLRVVREGELRAGDGLEVVHRPEHEVTVALVSNAMLVDPGLRPRLEAARADFTPELDAWLRPAA